ncbi:MAG: zf-HC2 domain-containing protein [Armatimonadota bacterium]
MSGGLNFGHKRVVPETASLRGGAPGTMTCHHAQELLSGYLEESLSSSERERVETHVVNCAECARELREMKVMLSLFKDQCVRREPALDLWAELAPKVEQVMMEERLGVMDRLRLRGSRFCNNVAAGAILFTSALAMNTEARLRKYLLSDPFHQEA